MTNRVFKTEKVNSKSENALTILGDLMKTIFTLMSLSTFILVLFLSEAFASQQIVYGAQQDYLVKISEGSSLDNNKVPLSFLRKIGFENYKIQVKQLHSQWYQIKIPPVRSLQKMILESSEIEYIQPNYRIFLHENELIKNSNDPLIIAARRAILEDQSSSTSEANSSAIKDNLEIPALPTTEEPSVLDPLIKFQWGLANMNALEAWKISTGHPNMIVAVIDTGVDYTHEDLLPNLWRNPGEMGLDANGKDKSNNGIDDDANGYIDDLVGWDFYSKDNKPYDLTTSFAQIILGSGNPGHGTHCAGNVAARGSNGKGISGVAPNVKIMSLRFISQKGEGTTSDAISAIKYAVDNGAKVLSNSWGSEGENPDEATENKALREVIDYAKSKGVLFVAAAGNGHQGIGYNNDTDANPSFPATYPITNIVSVAATDVKDSMGSFSNWGPKSVHIGAPGVEIYSTMVGNKYGSKIGSFLGQDIPWEGTSMACPMVAGAAALYWSAHPEKTMDEVKMALIKTARKTNSLNGKVVSSGILDLKALMSFQ